VVSFELVASAWTRDGDAHTPGPDQVRWTTSTLYDLFVRFHQGLRWFCHAPPRTMTEYLLRPPQTSAVPVKTPPPPPPLVQVLRASQGHLEHLGSRLRSEYLLGLLGVTQRYPPPYPLCPILLLSCPARPGVPSPKSPPFWSPYSYASPSPAQCEAALASLSVLLRQVFWRSRLWPPRG
jgi:hypothetical protein